MENVGRKRTVNESANRILIVGEDNVMAGRGAAEKGGGYGLGFQGEGSGETGKVSNERVFSGAGRQATVPSRVSSR